MRQIAVLLSTTEEYGRRVVTGALDHWQEQHVNVDMLNISGSDGPNKETLQSYDGIIAACDDQFLDRWTPPAHCQTVATPLCGKARPYSVITTCLKDVARTAGEHLQQLHMQHIVLAAEADDAQTWAIQQAFHACLKTSSIHLLPTCVVHDLQSKDTRYWLAGLPVSTALFCTTDRLACALADSICSLDREVPKDLALLGLGDAPYLCRTSTPEISSVAVAAEYIGRLAAQQLDLFHLEEDTPYIENFQSLPCLGVSPRQSTNHVAVNDPLIRQTVHTIRTNFLQSPSVEHLADQVGLARRTLDGRFVAAMGCTIHDELTRCRINWVCHELTHSDRPITELAEALSMAASNFTRFFKQHKSCSPGNYRSQRRR